MGGEDRSCGGRTRPRRGWRALSGGRRLSFFRRHPIGGDRKRTGGQANLDAPSTWWASWSLACRRLQPQLICLTCPPLKRRGILETPNSWLGARAAARRSCPGQENSNRSHPLALGQGLCPWRPPARKCKRKRKPNSASPQTAVLDTVHGDPVAHSACTLRRARAPPDKPFAWPSA
jgi:hypothetical protein